MKLFEFIFCEVMAPPPNVIITHVCLWQSSWVSESELTYSNLISFNYLIMNKISCSCLLSLPSSEEVTDVIAE